MIYILRSFWYLFPTCSHLATSLYLSRLTIDSVGSWLPSSERTRDFSHWSTIHVEIGDFFSSFLFLMMFCCTGGGGGGKKKEKKGGNHVTCRRGESSWSFFLYTLVHSYTRRGVQYLVEERCISLSLHPFFLSRLLSCTGWLGALCARYKGGKKVDDPMAIPSHHILLMLLLLLLLLPFGCFFFLSFFLLLSRYIHVPMAVLSRWGSLSIITSST